MSSTVFALLASAVALLSAQAPAPPTPVASVASLDEASRLYFAGHYDEAAAMALVLRQTPANLLASYELRTSALHFRLKREVAGQKDRKAALAACVPCRALIADLTTELAAGRAAAKTRLAVAADDHEARFFLGKIDLTHVWLQLETLGRRTGWGEYWEARRSLDAVLERRPDHLRALVARAWIDYIVDTQVPWALRWVLGGGDRKRALASVERATTSGGETYAVVEARFAHWEMLMRDGRRADALVVARVLYDMFPENRELERFLRE